MKNWLQKRFIRFLANNLFNTVTEDDIIKVVKVKDDYGRDKIIGVYVRGRKLDQTEIDSLKEGADQLLNSTLWKLLKNEIKFDWNERMYAKGLSGDDILAGKCALYNLKVIENTIKKMLSL